MHIQASLDLYHTNPAAKKSFPERQSGVDIEQSLGGCSLSGMNHDNSMSYMDDVNLSGQESKSNDNEWDGSNHSPRKRLNFFRRVGSSLG